jgi:hypothetical protein
VLEPITALAVVSYDGNDRPSGGALYGHGVLRRMCRPVFTGVGVEIERPFPHAGFAGTSALAGDLGSGEVPMELKTFQILPISRYWIDGPDHLTGRAMMFVKHGIGPLAASDISVLSFYFLLEEREAMADVAVKIAFLVTDTRYFARPFAAGGGKWTIGPPTPFIEWGTQTRLAEALGPPGDPAEGDKSLEQRIIDFAQTLGLQLP